MCIRDSDRGGKDLNHLAESPGLLLVRLVDHLDDAALARCYGPFREGGFRAGTRSQHAQQHQRFRPVVHEFELTHQITALAGDVAEIVRRLVEMEMSAALHAAGVGRGDRIGLDTCGAALCRRTRRQKQAERQQKQRFAAERERCPAVYGDRRSGRDISHRQFILNT